jgi:hypothetical protein
MGPATPGAGAGAAGAPFFTAVATGAVSMEVVSRKAKIFRRLAETD